LSGVQKRGPRAALGLRKGLSAGVRTLSPAFIIDLLAWVPGIKLKSHPTAIDGFVAVAALFSSFR
jgi:hypothetical protein